MVVLAVRFLFYSRDALHVVMLGNALVDLLLAGKRGSVCTPHLVSGNDFNCFRFNSVNCRTELKTGEVTFTVALGQCKYTSC